MANKMDVVVDDVKFQDRLQFANKVLSVLRAQFPGDNEAQLLLKLVVALHFQCHTFEDSVTKTRKEM